MTLKMTPALWAMLLLTATLFGSSFFFIKLTVGGIPPLTLAAGRAALAAFAVYLFMRILGQRLPELGRGWLPIIGLGVLTAVIPYVAIAWGQVHIDSSLGGILFATIPVFSVLVAPAFLAEEQLTTDRLLGVAVGLAGVALTIGPQALTGLGTQLLGAGVTIIAALSYATGNIYARRQSHLSPVVIATGQLVVATIVLVPISLAADRPWQLSPSMIQLANLAIVALVNTAAPVLLMFWLVRKAGASNTSLLAFFMPAVSVLLGVLILGEEFAWLAALGFALIILGAALVTGNFAVRNRQIPVGMTSRSRSRISTRHC
ncbi:MAG: DMT family transporter [Hyphomicrobiaceae bacterium]